MIKEHKNHCRNIKIKKKTGYINSDQHLTKTEFLLLEFYTTTAASIYVDLARTKSAQNATPVPAVHIPGLC